MPAATLPALPYDYNALQPWISQEIMELHHKKHHQAYVDGLNAADQNYASATTPKAKIALQAAIKFNGGGHINHSLFWKNLAPPKNGNVERTIHHAHNIGGVLKEGPLRHRINQTWTDFDTFKKEFNTAAAGIQGSGWAWLSLNPTNNALSIETTPNQDPLLTGVPIIGVDVWEHAYYLQYKNVRIDYLKAIWEVINFEEAELRFTNKGANL